MRASHISFLVALLLAAPLAGAAPKGHIIPSLLPDANQSAMINRQYGMFIHFGINTFSGQEWTDGTLKPETYNPTKLDTDQWVKAARDAGMTYVILITKHHDGFCLWDSSHTSYDVASSPVKTDVVKAMAASCKKFGIKLGLYYSLWDRNWNNGVMRGMKGDLTPEQGDAYVEYMEKQLTELLSNYGEVCELWLDGGWILPREDWQIDRVYTHVKKLQPGCLMGVNWNISQFDNPDFHPVKPDMYRVGQPIRYYPSDFRLGDPMLPEFPDVKHFTGPGGQLHYLPFETTVCLNNQWFWHPGDMGLRTVDELLPLFERATAQDNVLILNSPPNRDGVMEQRNVDRLGEFAAALGAHPGKRVPLNVAESAMAYSDSVYTKDPGDWSAAMAIDGNPATRWASAGISPAITLQWGSPVAIDFLRVREYENRIEEFVVEGVVDGKWKTLARGTTIGANRIISFPTTTTTALRLKIIKAGNFPSLWQLSAGQRASRTKG